MLPFDFFNMIVNNVVIVLDLELIGYKNDFFPVLPGSHFSAFQSTLCFPMLSASFPRP